MQSRLVQLRPLLLRDGCWHCSYRLRRDVKYMFARSQSLACHAEQAYYKLAKQYHPDTNQGDPEAAKKFQEVRLMRFMQVWSVRSRCLRFPVHMHLPARDLRQQGSSRRCSLEKKFRSSSSRFAASTYGVD